ncbi:MAG: UbiA family prenyltransferase [Saprospiraceae bacterium]|nr:UbiA family prenyltransferase [Saprospiraceae bacterium]
MLTKYLSLIKFSHTVFALPFAVIGFFMGSMMLQQNHFDPYLLVKVLLCMVFARSAAMAFNRYLDRDIDRQNPRTKNREIPAGILKEKQVLFFVGINVGLFILTTYFINLLCFLLSPVALLVILGYSYTKRFTAFCHLVLGLGLGLAPVGAYLAVTGSFHFLPVLLGLAVFFWVSGFDIIYALQDEEFDQNHQLKSIPAVLGKKNALLVSRMLHVCSALFLTLFSYQAAEMFSELHWLLYIGFGVFLSMLLYQHTLVSEKDLSRVNLAFFTFNGLASVTFGLFFIADVYLM